MADCLSRLLNLPNPSATDRTLIRMTATSVTDGPATRTHSKMKLQAGQCDSNTTINTCTQLPPEPAMDKTSSQETLTDTTPMQQGTPEVLTPSSSEPQKVNAPPLLPNDHRDTLMQKHLLSGKAPNHEADLFTHIHSLLYKHVMDTNQKFLALVIHLIKRQYTGKVLTKT